MRKYFDLISDAYDVQVVCPNTFRPINGSGCYHPVLIGSKVNWTKAEEACQNLNSGAHSLRLETDEVSLKLLNDICSKGCVHGCHVKTTSYHACQN